MDLLTIELVGLIVVPIVSAVLGYLLKTLNDKIANNKLTADRMFEQLEQDIRTAHRKDDHIRDVDRIDRDITNLRVDVTKGFDILRTQMSDDKKELLAAIHASKA